MKKKLLLCAGIVVMIAVIILGVWRYVEVRNRQTGPNWKIAEQIYNMENVLKEVARTMNANPSQKLRHTPMRIQLEIRSLIIAARPPIYQMSMGKIPG